MKRNQLRYLIQARPTELMVGANEGVAVTGDEEVGKTVGTLDGAGTGDAEGATWGI